MRRVIWNAIGADERARLLQRPSQATAPETRAAVALVLEAVRQDGDRALRDCTRRFDAVELDDFAVSRAEFAAAEAGLAPSLRAAIDEAAVRIRAFHAAGMAREFSIDTAEGVRCGRILRPIPRVGLYVPAGSAPLPSTALMLGIPAMLAGCDDIVLCTPPRRDGTADPAVLFAAQRSGIARVFKLGGAQAIAAMAFGTASVPRCDKLFGPGNAYVTEAKRQVAMMDGGAGIDMPAGPSEVLVIADAGATPAFVAADLLSQAEHGPDSQVVLISDDAAMLDAVADAMWRQLETLPRGNVARAALTASLAIRADSLEQAFAISNAYAPEHLILALRDARAWLPRVRSAGSVFVGDWAPEALGDYCSGTNHVLPTSGAARWCSGLGVSSFQTAITVQEVAREGIAGIGPCAVELASAEGLDAHRLAVQCRLEALAA
ncbi:histidinol dehydrogenase [Lysobacter yangpyeongensis]|jgi:histidinol dehydrogenase|uniref:Histidinol dehydrogenase n=1 Tax=Lysobacter yangpyeongensis TaxID=346182 RepID=A0ABW0SKZ8_9GAMM